MQKLDYFFIKVSDLLGWLAKVALLFLMLGTTADVVLRNIFNISVIGVFELSEIAMVLVVCLGLGWTFVDDGHIKVTLLLEKLTPRANLLVGAIVGVVVVVFIIFLAYPSTIEAIRSTSIKEFRWGVIEVPIWWAKVILSICLWFTCLQFLLAVLNNLRLLCSPGNNG